MSAPSAGSVAAVISKIADYGRTSACVGHASAWAQNSQIWDQILLMDLVRSGDERPSAWAVPSDSG